MVLAVALGSRVLGPGEQLLRPSCSKAAGSLTPTAGQGWSGSRWPVRAVASEGKPSTPKPELSPQPNSAPLCARVGLTGYVGAAVQVR